MKKKILYYILILIAVIPVTVFAEECQTYLTCDKDTIKPGEKVNCTVNLNESTQASLTYSNLFTIGDINSLNNFTYNGGQITYNTPTQTPEPEQEEGLEPDQPVETPSACVTALTFTLTATNDINETTTANVTLTPQDKTATTKTVTIEYIKSQDNSLSSLTIDENIVQYNNQTKSYNYETSEKTATIKATLNDPKASFKTNIGKVDLTIGTNTFYISVQAENGSIKYYTIVITRKDTRSKDNNLSALSISNGTLSPKFSPLVTKYTATVDNSISKVYINASLSSTSAKFNANFSPRTVSLNVGTNKFYIKVISETGEQKQYQILITRKQKETKKEETTTTTSISTYLKKLEIAESKISFDKTVYEYNISVLNEIEKLNITAEPENSKAKVTITGNENLQVGQNIILIKVTSTSGEKTYTINVERKPLGEILSDNNYLSDLSIVGYDIIFDKENSEYNIKINNEKQLDIVAISEEDTANVTITGNKELKNGSIVKISVISESGNERIYRIIIEKDFNILYIIIPLIGVTLLTIVILLIVFRKKIFKRNPKASKAISANILSK